MRMMKIILIQSSMKKGIFIIGIIIISSTKTKIMSLMLSKT